MTDKVKSQMLDMSTDQLVRAHFDAYTDWAWVGDFELKIRAHNLSADEMRDCRAEWNALAEQKYWAWWQNYVKELPHEKIKAEIMECIEGIKALEMRQQTLDPIEALGRPYLKILDGDNGQPLTEPAHSQTDHEGRDGQ